jgi:hypothetical protein
MWRAQNGFTLLSLIIALCSAAAAQPSLTPEPRPTQGDSDDQRIADLVVASRILVQEGVLDSFGHVTVRSLKNPNRYYAAGYAACARDRKRHRRARSRQRTD